MGHADQLLEDLDPEQREVATTLDGPVRVLAGAGTGKTRAITHRIAYGVATGVMAPTEVLAVTFTTRAAGELKERLQLLGAPRVQARTFHSAALRQARFFWPQVFGGELPEVVASKLGLVAAAVRQQRLEADQYALRDVAGEIEWAKVSNVTPDAYPEIAARRGRVIDIGGPAVVGKIYDAYEDVKRERHQMDFEDALLYAAAVLDADERVAMAVRKQYRWLVVDEFQDVSPLQFRLLQLWLGDGDRVCVVGDPAQTIYSFAGASDQFLRDFPRTFAETTSITLLRNYRSTPQVVELANTVMSRQLGSAAVRLRSQRGDGPAVDVTAYPDEEAEASSVADVVATAVAAGRGPEDFAVLTRINAQADAVADALRDRGVSFTRPGQASGVTRSVTREALAVLKGAIVGQAELSGDLERDVRDLLATVGWSQRPPDGAEARRRWDTLQGIVAAAERFARAHPGIALDAFVDDRRRSFDAGESHPGIGVTLTTLHAAKGLEWPVVHVLGAHEGNMPFAYRDQSVDIDEERRLFYVGVTRAQDQVHVSWSRARTPGGRAGRRQTRFLDGVAAAAATEGAPAPVARRRGKAGSLAACRVCGRSLTDARERKLGRCLGCKSPYNEDLYETLRAWRKETAAGEALPAYCVFTDATMQALAEVRPGDLDSLGRVPGIGPTKLSKYGEAILEICQHDAQPA